MIEWISSGLIVRGDHALLIVPASPTVDARLADRPKLFREEFKDVDKVITVLRRWFENFDALRRSRC